MNVRVIFNWLKGVTFHIFILMGKNVYRIVVLIAALAANESRAAVEPSVTPGENGQSYLIHTWKVGEGLPFNRIEDVLQRRNGFIWVATLNGAARFDGIEFQHFNTRTVPQLPDNQIIRLFEDRSGLLFMGHGTGHVSVRKDGAFVVLDCPDLWLDHSVSRFFETPDGEVWVENESGLRMKVAESGQPVPGPEIADPKRLDHLLTDRWTVLDDRVVHLVDEQILEDRGLSPWIIKEQEIHILECANGDLAAGSFYGGLFILHPNGKVSQVTMREGLASSTVLCLFEDAEHTLWVGTTSGLHSIRPVSYSVQKFPAKEWQFRVLRAIAPRKEGGIWAGSNKGVVYSYVDEKLTDIPEIRRPNEIIRRALLQGRKGVLWASDEDFLVRYAGRVARSVLPEPKNDDQIWVLNDDVEPHFWAGGEKGLWRFVSNCWTLILGAEQGVTHVRSLAQAKNGPLWIGTKSKGLFSWENGRLIHYDASAGLMNNYITALCIDEDDGSLWIGSCGNGLVYFKDGRFLPVPFVQNIISHILDDGHGRLWVVGEKGIAVVEKTEALQAAEAGKRIERYALFDKKDGLDAPIDIDAGLSTACRTPDGQFWFASDLQLTAFHPTDVRVWTNSVPVVITRTVVNDATFSLDGIDQMVVSPGVHRMDIHFAGLSYLSPSRLKFRCRMVGLSDEWRDLDSMRMASYQQLPSGKYRFEVVASNRDGIWNTEPAVLNVTVKPFYWETWWFKSLVYFSVSGLIVLISLTVAERLNRGRLILAEKRQAVEQERTRIAMDIHDEIGSELTRMQLLCHKVSTAVDRHDLDGAPKNVREMEYVTSKLMSTFDEIVWVVSPGNDNVENLVGYLAKFVSSFLRNTETTCDLDVPLEIPCNQVSGPVRHNLFLAVKEALNNIVKHAEATRIRFVVSAEPDRLTIALHDNGRGIASFEGERFQRGLRSMRRRMKLTGGIFNISNNAEGGTTVSFELPLKEEHV